MRKTFSVACSLMLLFCSCANGGNFTIKQDLNWLVQRLQGTMTVDSVMLKTSSKTLMFHAGEFTYENNQLQLTSSIDTPAVAIYDFYITSPKYTGKACGINIMLEEGNIEIAIDGNVYAAKGTPFNDEYFTFQKRLDEASSTSVIPYEEAIKDIFNEYITKHAADASAVLYLTDHSMTSDLSADLWLKGFEQCNAAVQNHRAVVKAKAKVEVAGRTAEGQPFVDFTATYNGTEQKLSDYVGKGKYVLVDFWASWCGPCKQEIPNLIAVYNKYKGEKFEVLGVATWDKPDDTLKAIESLGITYPQIMNAQREGSDAYGITGIPQIILFGPDGTILKRDLRGAQIEEAVANYLK